MIFQITVIIESKKSQFRQMAEIPMTSPACATIVPDAESCPAALAISRMRGRRNRHDDQAQIPDDSPTRGKTATSTLASNSTPKFGGGAVAWQYVSRTGTYGCGIPAERPFCRGHWQEGRSRQRRRLHLLQPQQPERPHRPRLLGVHRRGCSRHPPPVGSTCLGKWARRPTSYWNGLRIAPRKTIWATREIHTRVSA